MPIAPPLSDRTLKYGRNVMATAGVIIVLAWVPGIEIERFKPFGFDFSEGGTLAVWGILCVVLSYYFTSFVIGVWIEIPLWKDDPGGHDGDRRRANATIIPPAFNRAERKSARFTTWRMWLDVSTSTLMFLTALVAAAQNIFANCPA